MEKRINIFDVEIDGFTAKAAMKAAVEYMQSESINTMERRDERDRPRAPG